MYLKADWDKYYSSRKALESEFETLVLPFDKFKGWIESSTDTLFVQFIEPHNYHLFCWNEPEARKTIASYLGLPVYRGRDE